MTTQNKIPANWPEALAMADKIAQEVEIALLAPTDCFAHEDAIEYYESTLRRIGKLVGWENKKK